MVANDHEASRLGARDDWEMPYEQIKVFLARLRAEPKQDDARRWTALPVYEISEVFVRRQQHALFAGCPIEHVGVGCAARELANASNVVPLCAQPIHQKGIDILIGQDSH